MAELRGEQFAMNDNMSYSTVARDRRCRKGATERESENIPEERHQLEAAEAIYDRPEQSESSEGEELAINDNIDRRHREGGTERDIPEERQLEAAEVIYDQPLQSPSGEQFAMNDNAAYSTTVVRGRRHREDATERESGEELLLETAGAIYDRPEQAAGEEQFAINDNMAYSTTVARDRRCSEDATERESGEELQLETAGAIYDRPEQAAGEEQFAMSDNMSYSTVARDRRCREGATEERQLETGGAIYDQAPSGEQFAMDDNMAYSTTVARDRMCRKGVTVRESEDIPEEEHQLEIAGVICDRTEQAARGEQFAMDDNMAYSTTVARDRRCREGVPESHIPEEGQLETAEVIYDRPEQAARGEQFAMNDNISYSTVARDRRCRKGATERESENIPKEEGALVYTLIFDAKYY